MISLGWSAILHQLGCGRLVRYPCRISGAWVESRLACAALATCLPELDLCRRAVSYGGALEDSARECNRAYSLDSGDYCLRSCHNTFLQLGDYRRAAELAALDPLWAGGPSATDIGSPTLRRPAVDMFAKAVKEGLPTIRNLLAIKGGCRY